MSNFELVAEYKPAGDQKSAIKALTEGLKREKRQQTLLGVTGSGKTFTIAKVIGNVQRPTLVISHNKTLAAQLYCEFREFFPHNAVEYFVSYYDYYQPEAYIPQTDTYIEKDASINDEIDRLRLSATSSLLERNDVIIVASVSCIYGLGSPEEYRGQILLLEKGEERERQEILENLISMQYERNDIELTRGKFRVRGDTLEIFPAYGKRVIRVEMFGDEVERIEEVDPLTGGTLTEMERVAIYPAKHFITSGDQIKSAVESIKVELAERLEELKGENKLLEAQRLEARTNYDIEMLLEIGYCQGIENYSRHISHRAPGTPPYTLIDYFPKDLLTIIDESHATIPQLNGMYNGDRARKETLVEYGFRLPSALDNRPLKFEEFEKKVDQVIFVSATPGPYELKKSSDAVEQVIRPTGLVDPPILVKPVERQVEDLLDRISERAKRRERVLVTTLTKRTAEDLAEYLHQKGVKVRYMHSEIGTIERAEILHDLRAAKFDCLVGINLLREGLDLPEVSLVAILDADKEGFLRSQTSLIQTAGRAARNVGGEVIMYADRITSSMRRALDESKRRRELQLVYNKKHSIVPRTIQKAVKNLIERRVHLRSDAESVVSEPLAKYISEKALSIAELERAMYEAAEKLEFEKAAELRDRITELKSGQKPPHPSLSPRERIKVRGPRSSKERPHGTQR